MNASSEPGTRAPEWARSLFTISRDHLLDLINLLDLSTDSIQRQVKAEQMVELSKRVATVMNEPHDDELHAKRLDRARVLAAFAAKEVDRGFPTLFGQAAVSLWSSLENLVFNLVVGLLENEPHHLTKAPFDQIKVRVSDFAALDGRTRAEFLALALDEQLAGPMKHGIGRFEELLKPFDLSGIFDKTKSQHLHEMQQVRNLFAHRQGIVDRRFSKSCSWMRVTVGEPLHLSKDMMNNYFDAAVSYLEVLLDRFKKKGAIVHTSEEIRQH